MKIKIVDEAENIVGQSDLHPSENEALNIVCDLARDLVEAIIQNAKNRAAISSAEHLSKPFEYAEKHWPGFLEPHERKALIKAGIIEE